MTVATWNPWETAPRDGTPFCLGQYARFNPYSKEWETLFRVAGGEFEWCPAGDITPTRWLPIPEARDDLPKNFLITYSFAISRAEVEEMLVAQGIEAGTGETEGLDAQRESPVANGDAP